MLPRILLIVAVGSLLLGCRQSREPDGRNLIPLRSSVIFSLEEEEGKVRLLMWTTEVFPCLNYELRTDYRQRKSRFEVTIKGIVPPRTCFGKEGPARYTRSLGSLSGTYELVIRSQRETDRYRVTVVRDRIRIRPMQQSFTDYWR